MNPSRTKKILDDNPDLKKQWTSLIPQGKMGQPEDLMGAVTFLCSDASGYVTGAYRKKSLIVFYSVMGGSGGDIVTWGHVRRQEEKQPAGCALPGHVSLSSPLLFSAASCHSSCHSCFFSLVSL